MADKEKPKSKSVKAKEPSAKKIEDKMPSAKKVEANPNPETSTKTKGSKPIQPPRPPLIGRTPITKQGTITGWRLVDAAGQTLGRLSSSVANILMGKDKPGFNRFMDTGDHVIIVNAEKVNLTGKKWSMKTYHYHTNYPGGIKTYSASAIRDGRFPERIVQWAIYGMLPKGHMGRRWYKKLHVYKGGEHPHSAQKPVPVEPSKLGTLIRD